MRNWLVWGLSVVSILLSVSTLVYVKHTEHTAYERGFEDGADAVARLSRHLLPEDVPHAGGGVVSVYVDKSRNQYRNPVTGLRMVMCHMIGDTEAELHAMAERLGLQRKWFQSGSVLPHYDICLTKRSKALKLGAKEISRQQFVDRIRAARKANAA